MQSSEVIRHQPERMSVEHLEEPSHTPRASVAARIRAATLALAGALLAGAVGPAARPVAAQVPFSTIAAVTSRGPVRPPLLIAWHASIDSAEHVGAGTA